MMKFLTALPKSRMLNCLWAIIFIFLLSPDARSQTFTHPGIPLSGSDLSILKAHVQAGDYPWKQAYDILAADGKSQLTYQMQGPFDSVARNINYNLNQWRSDMTAAFFQSMMWYFTGNEAYAIKARDILVAWANTQRGFGGQEANLDLGDYAYAYGGAASILRGTWSGWTASNTADVKKLFNNVYWKAAVGCCGGFALGPANKGTLSIAAAAAIAAFSDDPAKVAHVVHMMRYIASTGYKNTLPSGEHGESGRDQGHSHGMWSSIAFAAEVLWKQGLDLYSEQDNRLLALGEYFARRNTEGSIGFIPFGTTDWYYLTDPPGTWDGGRWGLTLAYGAYNVRKKLNTPYISRRLTDIPRRLDPVYTWFYKSEDNSTAFVPPQTEIVPEPGKVGAGGLTDLDVGTASPAGSSSYSNNIWTVTGGGTEILTHAADGFHFVYREVTGNFSILAKVESVGGTALNARAGLMIRSDLTATSAQRAWIAIKSGKRAQSFMHGWTEMRGGSNWEKPERAIPQDSYWIKIDRVGDLIATYYSPDGVSWAAECQGRMEGFTGKAYIGLAVCSNADGTPMTSTFSNVSVTGGEGGMVITPEAPHSVYAFGGNNQVQVRWLSSFGAESYTIKRSTSAGGPFTTIALNLSGNSFLDKNVMNGQTYYYTVCAVNAAGTSADAPADGGTPKAPYVAQKLEDGIYRIIATNSGKAVEVKDGSTDDGALVAQNTYSFSSNQHWIINSLSGADYKIINLRSGKSMDVVNNAITDAAAIEQRTWSDADEAQVWFIKDRENGTFNIEGKPSGKVLDVAGSSILDGAAIDLNKWVDNPNQIFRIERVTAADMDSAYFKKLAEAIKLRDTTQTSDSIVGGKFPVAAKVQLNDSITYVQSLYNPQLTITQINGLVIILENAIERYKAAMYYYTNTLADGNYYLKTFGSDLLWTRNETNTPLFDVPNPNPLLQLWNVKKLGNGRYKITCLSAPPSSFSNYINESALFGRDVTAFSDIWSSLNIYANGTSYAVQRAQSAGNGFWYKSDNKILFVAGSDNDPVPYSFPFQFVPAGTVPISLTAAAADGKNVLEWDPIADFTYNVKRSTIPGGPYTTIATVSTAGFTDTAVNNGTSYYYIVISPDSVASSQEVVASRNVGLIYLKFDETSGTRCISSWGTSYGTMAATATRDTGKTGNALKLDGTANAYATLPTGIMSTVSDFTISTWVKMDALANWMRVFDFGNSTTQYMYLTVQGGTTTVNGVTLSTVKYGIINGGAELSVTSSYAFPLNTWVHLAVTQSGNTVKLYINGALVRTNTNITINPSQLTPTGTTSGTAKNYLGKSQWSADPIFKGSIEEFKIYKRALPASEIAESMMVGQTITFNPIAPRFMGDADFDLEATASSGLPVTYTSSDTTVATIEDSTVHILAGGTAIITASQAGNEVYGAASQARSLLIGITSNTQLTTLLGRPFSYTITNRPYSNFTATGLPAGLSVNTTTGVISGTPTEYGSFSVVIGATNGSISGTQTITLTVQNSVASNVLVANGDARIVLEWDPVQNLKYNIKRSASQSGPFNFIGTVDTPKFADSLLTNDTTYYYVIAGVDSAAEYPGTAPIAATPRAGQWDYYTFNDSIGAKAIDSWGARHGMLTGAATRTSGVQGGGVKLNGSNGYVSLPSGLMSAVNDFTIAGWVKIDASAAWARLFDFGTGSSNYMYLSPLSSSNTVRYAIKVNGSSEQQLNNSTPLSTGEWHHVAVTLSGTTGTLYVDGVAVNTNTSMTYKPSGLGVTTQNYIGKSQFNDPYLNGVVDEFRIYNRALNAAEIKAVYTQYAPPLAPTNLVVALNNSQPGLSWTGSVNAASYNIKRATSLAGPYTTIATAASTTYTDTSAASCGTYFYVVSANSSISNLESANSSMATLFASKKLTGTVIGTSGSWNNNPAATKTAAVDGDLNTYFDGPTANGVWVGYDLGVDSTQAVFKIRYAPRSTQPSRMSGGVFQGSNLADFSTAKTLYTIKTAPAAGVYTEQIITSPVPYRYVRYLSPNNGFGNVAEIEFYGMAGSAPQITTKAGTQNLSYGAAFSYAIQASNTPNNYSASGLPNGLSLNACTGVISGTLNAAGTFPVVLTASTTIGSAKDTMLLIVKKDQTITFNALQQKKVGDDDFNAGAIASSGLAVKYSSSDTTIAKIVNGLIRIVGTGTTGITASQSGDSIYKAATAVSQQLSVYQLPTVKTKNIQIAVDANGYAFITPVQVNDSSVSYSGSLILTLDRTEFTCADIGAPITVTLTATDADGHADSGTAQVTIIDDQKPVLAAPANRFFCNDQSGAYNVSSLTATDNCGIASISYSVSGATARNGIGADASGVFNAGQSTISWTVTDSHGNVDTAATIVTVNAAMSAGIPDVYAMNPAVDARNTIYIGYGPASLTISANASGGTAPYTWSWSNGATSQSINVSAAGAYSVTATDSKGCTTTAAIVMSTLDVRCGNNNDKVMICHNNNTICVAASAVQAHLNHGDHLGACTASVARTNTENRSVEVSSGKIFVYPNPVTEEMNVQISGVEAGSVIKMYNQNGVLVKTLLVTKASETIPVRGLAAGMYYLQIKTRGVLITRKIVKL